MFNTQNSGRRVTQDSPSWKSRALDLGNRHRTTLNFADLVPAYWTFAQPGDKFRMDANILAKFMPLIAPAFSRMKIKSEWFYVPLRQISPSSLRALQDFKPEPQDVSSYFTQLMHGFSRTQSQVSDDQQISMLSGFPSIPAYVLNAWLCGETATRLWEPSNPSNGVILGSDFTASTWRAKDRIDWRDYKDNIGWENLTTYSTKRRASRLMSYMGLPSRVIQMQFSSDVVFGNLPVSSSFYVAYSNSDRVYRLFNSDYSSKGIIVDVDADNISHTVDFLSYVNKRYLDLAFLRDSDSPYPFAVEYRSCDMSPSSGSGLINAGNTIHYHGFAESFGFVNNAAESSLQFSNSLLNGLRSWSESEPYKYLVPYLSTYCNSLVTLLPFQAYQKVFNDFYRDEKLQSDEIRYYPDAVLSSEYRGLSRAYQNGDLICRWDFPSSVFFNNQQYNADDNDSAKFNVFMNNIFGLRRRNRAKDVISSCVTSQVVLGQLSQGENETVYNANLYSKLAKYFMKKEFTGSTWAEWLNNFFGVNSNDLLNNNVVFLGGRESVVSISENIQNSQSTDQSAQGNRAGLANDFHSGKEIYFRAPDFGVIMCIVSVIPDDIDNFNGLAERFSRSSVFDWNLPDLQNIGFSPLLNRRVNVGLLNGDSGAPDGNNFPSPAAKSSGVFGYQPFGYSHTYTPNIISGDFQSSLRYWHQSPDLDFDFTKSYPYESLEFLDYKSWAENQLSLNANLPSIGLRFQPLGSSLASQYYNNVFADTSDESGDHIVADMRFAVTCHRNTAFFTDAIQDEK